jgi:hypothetical protein
MQTSPFSPNGVHHPTDEAIDSLYSFWPGTTPAPQPLPEAAFSLTLKGTLDGHEALLTARGHKPRHDLLATSVHLSRPYSVGLGLMSNEAA